MITLNKEEIFNILKKKLAKHFPTLSGEPDMWLSLNSTRKIIAFNQHIISFKYENDILRRLTTNEVNKMLREEYLNSLVNVEVCALDTDTLSLEDYNKAAVLQAKVQFDDSVHLSESYIRALIDVALDKRDKEWFDELVGQLNKNT